MTAPSRFLIPTLAGFSPAGRYLVGVSGGRDSVALLHALGTSGYRNLVVCHFDHCLRGRSSAADARFVAKLAADHRLALKSEAAPVRDFARRKKLSLESAARELRYSFFARVARRTRRNIIFLGHHADDLVETFLINLFRGSGMTGLSAMREVSTRRVGGVKLTIVRPLLTVWREDIDDYVRRHRLKFREDATNRDLAPLRNRIRKKLIPYLEKTIGRNIRRNIWRAGTILAEEENFFETLLPKTFDPLTNLPVARLRQTDIAVQRRIIHSWLQRSSVPDIGFDLVERIRSLLDTTRQIAKTNLPRDRHVRRRSGKLFIE